MSAKQPLIDFAPALTWQQVEEHEARTDIGVQRRIMLATLTRSSQELFDAFSTDETSETLLLIVEQITAHRDYLTACIEFADAACARLLIVADAIVNAEGDADETLLDSCEGVTA